MLKLTLKIPFVTLCRRDFVNKFVETITNPGKKLISNSI